MTSVSAATTHVVTPLALPAFENRANMPFLDSRKLLHKLLGGRATGQVLVERECADPQPGEDPSSADFARLPLYGRALSPTRHRVGLSFLRLGSPEHHGNQRAGDHDSTTPQVSQCRKVGCLPLRSGGYPLVRMAFDNAIGSHAEVGNGRGEVGHHGITIRAVMRPRIARIRSASDNRHEDRRRFRMDLDHLTEKGTQ